MKTYGFTGPRKIDTEELIVVQKVLRQIREESQLWLFGDAKGVDNIVHNYAVLHRIPKMLFQVPEEPKKSDFAIRSMKMVDMLNTQSGSLIGFLNKNCPEDCTLARPFCGHGSGTWGTVAYARSKGMEVHLFALGNYDLDLPEWFHYQQLTLF